MKYALKKLLLVILAVLFVCSALTSCGNNSDDKAAAQDGTKQTDGGDSEGTEAPTEDPYEYPDLNGEGKDFKFLNPTNTWFYYTTLVHEEMTGEVLDDTIYQRNRTIEEKFNINLKEIVIEDTWGYNGTVRKNVKSGVDEYDAIFCHASFNGTVGSMITEGLFHDLAEIPTMNLDGEWWNQAMLKEARIGTKDKIFYTGSAINLMTVQAVSCVYFNQDLMTDLGLELPYNIVKEGKWTFDMFQQYLKNGTQLNGADDFTWNPTGRTQYGMVGYEDSSSALLAGSGELFVTSDNSGNPVLGIESERFMSVLTKIGDILNLQNGNYLYANDADNIFHYEPIFMNGRALMTIGELKAANIFRAMDATFGLLPIPKYNETQPNYYSHLFNQTPVLTIPVTNQRTEFTGAVLDAMAYVSDKEVIPVLFDVSVSQKQLRNDESVEMLEIIKNSGSFDVGVAYGWTNTLYDLVRTTLGEGKPMSVASEIEKNKDVINKNIQKTMDKFE